MCETVWRFDQEYAIKRWLATNSRVATCQNEAHVWSMQEDEESRQPNHYMTKSTIWPSLVTGDWNSQLIPVVKWLANAPCFAKKWLFTFHLIPYCKYLYTHGFISLATCTTSTLLWILGESILKPKRVLIHKNDAEAHNPKLMAI